MAALAGNPINFPGNAIPFAYRGIGANPRARSVSAHEGKIGADFIGPTNFFLVRSGRPGLGSNVGSQAIPR